jgi:hypothetical protein
LRYPKQDGIQHLESHRQLGRPISSAAR